MPELPEVETVRRVLHMDLVGKKINNVEVRYKNIIVGDVESFKANVEGKTIKDVKRYAKFLQICLSDGIILSHLRMEGKYFYLPTNTFDNKHVHVIYHLDNGYDLIYQDVRKFGRMEYKTLDDLYTTRPLNEIGYDLVLTDFTPEIKKELLAKINKKRVPIKTILLDQSIMAGLGNIYVDEVLFDSHINPHRPGNLITKSELNEIIKASILILNKAIELKGTTIRSYTSSLGVEGGFQNFLNVHTKNVCPHCNNALCCDKIGGRSSYYCERCQK